MKGKRRESWCRFSCENDQSGRRIKATRDTRSEMSCWLHLGLSFLHSTKAVGTNDRAAAPSLTTSGGSSSCIYHPQEIKRRSRTILAHGESYRSSKFTASPPKLTWHNNYNFWGLLTQSSRKISARTTEMTSATKWSSRTSSSVLVWRISEERI